MREKPGPQKTLYFFFLISILCSPVMGLSIGFMDESLAGAQELRVYYTNGSYIGTYNTSSVFDVNESVVIHIAPDRADYIRNPTAFLDNLVAFTGDHLLEILILCFVIGFFITRR